MTATTDDTTRIDAAWLHDEALQAILGFLNRDGERARIVGGAVRNHLFGEEIGDVDIATTCLPEETVRRAEAAGFRTVPTGIEHGTVMVVADHHGFEVTTLREDIETDGRRAVVAFGRDWEHDAHRRDFTVNALYCEADGTIVDLVGGLPDIENRTIRFIGTADNRIREDYLRILRFFRFFAWYGSGRPDAAGLLACTRLKDGLAGLSAERIWSEMRKLLSAPDPSRTLLWMRQAGVLTQVLPESEKWGIDGLPAYIAAEKALGWEPDPLARLMTMIAPRVDRATAVATRWKLSNADKARLEAWAKGADIGDDCDERELAQIMYRTARQPVLDQLRLSLAGLRAKAEDDAALLEAAARMVRLERFAVQWTKPVFPVSGRDLQAVGHVQGNALGNLLRELETRWIDSGFALTREALLEAVDKPSG
ncbi:CCA tRNA nucleotidyltransferase [Oricola sp.]|uniref:CCA tRNA nucleotidyltransferase n=1 Tax=Oricola sp. TaxID=1979950 RepID=UPI003BAC8E85